MPTTIRAILADDERLMREQLRARLAEVWPELEIVAEAKNGTVRPSGGRKPTFSVQPSSDTCWNSARIEISVGINSVINTKPNTSHLPGNRK